MTRHNTAANKELPEDLPQELRAADRVWVRRGDHAPPLAPLYDGPYASSSAASATSGSRWATGRTTSPPPGSSPAPAEPPSPRRRRPGAAGPGRSSPIPRRRPSASASTSAPPHRQRQLTLELFFLASLPGFLHAQGKHLQAATRNATAGRLPGNGTTPSSPLAATKKLGGALWAPYNRGACTSPARDTQYYATSPEPVSLHNISSSISCVYSNHNVHMYTLNKVSTLLPLVLITSYCVGTSTGNQKKVWQKN
jgi:hypothetical protein